MTGVWFISFCKTIQYFDLPSEWFKDSDRSRVCYFTIVIYCSRYPRKWKLVKKTRNSSAFLRIFLYPLTHFQKIQKDKSKWSLIHAVPIFPNFLSLWRLTQDGCEYIEEFYHNCSLGISMYALRVQKSFEIDLFRKIMIF